MDATFTEDMMQGPDGSILRFFYDSVKNEQATNAEGRAIFDTVLFVDVITPGQKSSTPRFEIERVWAEQSKRALGVSTPSKKSFKYNDLREYVERFKNAEAAHDMGGTPLKMWPRIDRGLAATLMAANVFTVEQLAEVTDNHLDIIGIGARDLREQAKEFLKTAAGSADTSALVAKVQDAEKELARIRADNALANQEIQALRAQLDKMTGVPSSQPTSRMADVI